MGSIPSHVTAERSKWLEHTLDISTPLRQLQMSVWKSTFTVGSMVRLCSVERHLGFLSYHHYFLESEGTFFEFDGEDIYSSTVRIHSNPKPPGYKVIQEKPIDQECRLRMKSVLGSSNYSLLLRNCEHVSRFVFFNQWLSNQTVDHESIALTFMEYSNGNVSQFLNRRPAELSLDADGSARAYYEGKHTCALRYVSSGSFMNLKETAYNIVFLGPTRSGKSYLINKMVNRRILKAETGIESVTTDMAVVKATGLVAGSMRRFNLVDTVGLCDSKQPAVDILRMVKSHVKNNVGRVNLFVVVLPQGLTGEQKESLKDILAFAKFRENPSHFVFVFTKKSTLDREDWERLSNDMMTTFGVPKLRDTSPTHNIQFIELGTPSTLTMPEGLTQELDQIIERVQEKQIVYTPTSCQIL